MSGGGTERLLVIGFGTAAQRLLDRLDRQGYPGAVTVIGAEPYRAYQRDLLPAVAAGRLPAEALALPGPPAGTRLRLAVTARDVDRRRQAVRADDGEWYPYDRLVLATGTRPRIPRVAGLRGPTGGLADGVTTLHTRAEVERFAAGRVIVLGADTRAVRTALALAVAGREVILVHPGPFPLYDLLDPAAGAFISALLARCGVVVHSGRQAVEYRPGKLRLDDGATLAAEMLVVSAGGWPDTRLAQRAGLAVRHGVLVDDRLGTDDPRISAIGGCAAVNRAHRGRQAPHRGQSDVLADVLGGEPVRYRPARPVTRLAAAELDLAVLGRPRWCSVPADTELVTLNDPARRRYARLALRAGRIDTAVVLNLPTAAAALIQLYDRDLPVPADRLGLLLGPTDRPRYGGRVETDPVLCVCNAVTRSTLTRAWQQGARSWSELVGRTRVTTGCGSCQPDVRRLCDRLAMPA